jgi:hypothetical protein
MRNNPMQSTMESPITDRNSICDNMAMKRTASDLNQSFDAVEMRSGPMAFGGSFYRPPNNDYALIKAPSHKISKSKIGSFIDEHTKSLQHVPCSAKYSKIVKWGSRYRGKFERQNRVSMTQHYMNIANRTPASNKYITERKYKTIGNYKS